MRETVLVVDDDISIADLVELCLRGEGYEVQKFYRAREAVSYMDSNQPDIAILDVMLPDMDGFTLCQEIRKKYRFPVIFLSAKGEEIDKITGLSLGGDDYIAKPFQPMELVARVKAQLRRSRVYNCSQENQDRISFGTVVMDRITHICTIGGLELSLTPTEFSILWLLCDNRGRVIGAEEIFKAVWGDGYYNGNNTVMVHIRHIRTKIASLGIRRELIKTVWGVGYTIV